jgi:hypothetical protein
MEPLARSIIGNVIEEDRKLERSVRLGERIELQVDRFQFAFGH